jgi:hypothetical protein
MKRAALLVLGLVLLVAAVGVKYGGDPMPQCEPPFCDGN